MRARIYRRAPRVWVAVHGCGRPIVYRSHMSACCGVRTHRDHCKIEKGYSVGADSTFDLLWNETSPNSKGELYDIGPGRHVLIQKPDELTIRVEIADNGRGQKFAVHGISIPRLERKRDLAVRVYRNDGLRLTIATTIVPDWAGEPGHGQSAGLTILPVAEHTEDPTFGIRVSVGADDE